MAQLIPIAAGKAKKKSADALTGDIYVRRWTTTKGAGKKKREIEHELHVNPLMIAGTAIGAGIAAAGAGLTLWLAQKKVTRADTRVLELVIDQMDTTYKEVQVVVTEAYTYDRLVWHEPVYYTEKVPIAYDDEGNPIAWKTVEMLVTEGYTTTVTETVPAVYETRTVVDKPGHYLVKSKRGIPYAKRAGIADKQNVLTQYQRSMGYVFLEEVQPDATIDGGVRKFWRFVTDRKGTLRLGDREGFKFIGGNFDIM